MTNLTPYDRPEKQTIEHESEIEHGQWYWVTTRSYEGRDTPGVDEDGYLTRSWLGCVMAIGSNFVEFEGVKGDGKYYDSASMARVHFDEFFEHCKYEPNADAIIAERVGHYQGKMGELLGHIKEVTRQLGVVPQTEGIEDQTGGMNQLAVISTQVDTASYKNALIEAKEKTLPDLYKEMKAVQVRMAGWMTAPTLPMRATITPMSDTIKGIDDRIYTLGLYAGLTEDAKRCCDGDPAARNAKLHVMQRRLYMDEECLLDYQAGGMEFRDIGRFDEWISKPENRDRLMPFPRCIVGFRVRRNEKEREDGSGAWRAFVNVQLAQADKFTFFYVRNGEQVWRITTEFEFDDMLFPDSTIFDPNAPLMVKGQGRGSSWDSMMTVASWEKLRDEEIVQKRNYDEWEREHGDKKNPGGSWINNPYRNSIGFSFSYKEYKPFDRSNIYYDEIKAAIDADIKRWNRIAVIIQGLFDRSPVLNPHDPVQVWSQEGFEKAIHLVFDSTTLTHGEAPDFEEFRAKLNALMTADSVVTGQDDYWARIEAERENRRNRNDYRDRSRRSNYRRFRPYQNPGPGVTGVPTEWKPRARKAVFRWEMERTDWRAYRGDMKSKLIEVPIDELLNVSAYTPGDYKRFFSDPRTRKDYLKWAPLMLAAEDWHAGLGDKTRATPNDYDFY